METTQKEIQGIQFPARVPKGEPGIQFFRDVEGDVAVLRVGEEIDQISRSEAQLRNLVLPEWTAGGDYTVFALEGEHAGEFIIVALRDGEHVLWGTMGMRARGDAARHLMGPDFNWGLATSPKAWIQQGVEVFRDAENMFPELQWAIEWDAVDLGLEGRECSMNLKKG